MRKKIIKKLNSNSGESLVEALTAILIISLTFAFLCNTIASATKINSMTKAKHPEVNYDYAGGTVYSIIVSQEKGGGNDSSRHLSDSVTVYMDKNKTYLYY